VKTGRTETRINLLAIRRVQLQIDRALKKSERELTAQATQPLAAVAKAAAFSNSP
jgi:hypothetical protein